MLTQFFGNEFYRAAVNRVFGFLRQTHAFEFAVGLTAIGRGAHGHEPLAGEHEMIKRDARKGLATLCIGGGQGVALAVERA